jgi:hypothetical protein
VGWSVFAAADIGEQGVFLNFRRLRKTHL